MADVKPFTPEEQALMDQLGMVCTAGTIDMMIEEAYFGRDKPTRAEFLQSYITGAEKIIDSLCSGDK